MTNWVPKIPQKPLVAVEGAESGLKRDRFSLIQGNRQTNPHRIRANSSVDTNDFPLFV